MDAKLIRIKDIALKAKVSTGTVDRVIHNRGKVSEKVRVRIQQILDESNYEPNLMARALGSKKQYRLAALIPDHRIDDYWDAPRAGIAQAQKELRQYGLSVTPFVFNPYQADSYMAKAEELTRFQPDGILLSPIYYHETLPFFGKWKAAGIPFVLFNTEIADYGPLSYIGQDSYQSGQLAAKLMHYGQSEPRGVLVVHIDEKTSNAAHLVTKEKGLRDYFDTHSEPRFEVQAIEVSRSEPAAFEAGLDAAIAATPHLKHIFVTTSKAHYVAAHLEARGIGHISIIGYDLVPANVDYLQKGSIGFLINQNPRRQGYLGITRLADFLIFKKEVARFKFLPLDIVTCENLHYYLDAEDEAQPARAAVS